MSTRPRTLADERLENFLDPNEDFNQALYEDLQVDERERQVRRAQTPYPVDSVYLTSERTSEQEVTTQAELLKVQQQHQKLLEELNRKLDSICMVQSSTYTQQAGAVNKLQQDQQLRLREVEKVNLETRSELRSCRLELRACRSDLKDCRTEGRSNLLEVISRISSKIDFRFIYLGISLLISLMLAVIILISHK